VVKDLHHDSRAFLMDARPSTTAFGSIELPDLDDVADGDNIMMGGHWAGVAALVIAGGAFIVYTRHRSVTREPRCAGSANVTDVHLSTGDIVLAVDDTAASSRLPRIIGNCPFTHVGVAYVNEVTGHRYVWDICADNPRRPDEPESDVYLHTFDTFVREHYARGRVFLRPLLHDHHPPACECTACGDATTAHNVTMRDFMREHWAGHEFSAVLSYATLQKRMLPGLPSGLQPPRRGARAPLLCVDLAFQTLEALGIVEHRRGTTRDIQPTLLDFCSPLQSSRPSGIVTRAPFTYGDEVRVECCRK